MLGVKCWVLMNTILGVVLCQMVMVFGWIMVLMNTILGVVLWVLVVDDVLKFGASEGTCW